MARIYSLFDPNGIKFETSNMKTFCEEHRLSYSGIMRVVNGKQQNYRGWTSAGTFAKGVNLLKTPKKQKRLFKSGVLGSNGMEYK